MATAIKAKKKVTTKKTAVKAKNTAKKKALKTAPLRKNTKTYSARTSKSI
jgi:hypothetical protein